MIATNYMVTCPHCAALVEFKTDNLFVGFTDTEPNIKSLKCPTCEASDEIAEAALTPISAPVDPDASIVVQHEAKIQTETKVKVVKLATNPFIDPVEAGLVDTKNYRL
jgi:endogenous inhibitor of DNA gyrase (YacG/DUF329 family)